MDFLKKHYEKLILGIVLLGLGVAVASLPIKITSERTTLTELTENYKKPKVPPLTNLDLTVQETVLKRAAMPALIDLSSSNKLFNPFPWMQTKDTPPRVIPSNKAGPSLTVVTNITPLYLKLSLEGANLSADSNSAVYVIGVIKEASPKLADRTKKTTYCRLNEKKDKEGIIVTKATGPLDDPTSVVLELLDTGEKVTLTKQSKEVPYKRIDGYAADVSYPPEKFGRKNQRVGDMLKFASEEYKIVAINPNELVLSANSNQKKWTIKSNQTL
jgi:hypothetical protein